MRVLVNFATEDFYPAQIFNSKTALTIGGFDTVRNFNPSDIDQHFLSEHNHILSQRRGAGYWLWKPYFILKALENLKNNDTLMYADSACHFIQSANPLLLLPEKYFQDIIPFELEHRESAWTKRDAFVLMNCDTANFYESNQRLASFIVIRKSAHSIAFMNDYLQYCTNPQILTDMPNTCGLENFSDFCDHRHDQSVFSLLTKKYGFQAFSDPCQWGNQRRHLYPNSNYTQIIEHTRQKSPKQAKLSYRIKRFFFPK